jgi:hypothetical protein
MDQSASYVVGVSARLEMDESDAVSLCNWPMLEPVHGMKRTNYR